MSMKQALSKIDVELDAVAAQIEAAGVSLRQLEARQDALLLARSFMAPEDEEVKRLPAPEKKPRRAKVAKEPKSKSVPAAVDSECPLEWEVAGVTFTLPLKQALLLREMIGEESETEVRTVSQERLVEVIGGSSPAAFFTELRGLRQALHDAKTGTTIESVRGQGYRHVAEEG